MGPRRLDDERAHTARPHLDAPPIPPPPPDRLTPRGGAREDPDRLDWQSEARWHSAPRAQDAGGDPPVSRMGLEAQILLDGDLRISRMCQTPALAAQWAEAERRVLKAGRDDDPVPWES